MDRLQALRSLADSWRDDAERFRVYGAEKLATACERHADDLEVALRAHLREELTLREAAAESGYSVRRLRELVREGKIPDNRPDGGQGEIRVRRCDLPRKPAADREAVSPVDSLAAKLQERGS